MILCGIIRINFILTPLRIDPFICDADVIFDRRNILKTHVGIKEL